MTSDVVLIHGKQPPRLASGSGYYTNLKNEVVVAGTLPELFAGIVLPTGATARLFTDEQVAELVRKTLDAAAKAAPAPATAPVPVVNVTAVIQRGRQRAIPTRDETGRITSMVVEPIEDDEDDAPELDATPDSEFRMIGQ